MKLVHSPLTEKELQSELRALWVKEKGGEVVGYIAYGLRHLAEIDVYRLFNDKASGDQHKW